jgi:hypothetical protein
MEKLGWGLLVFFTIIGTTADGLASGFTLLAMIQANNSLAKMIVMVGGFLITGMAIITKNVLAPESPVTIKLVWFIAIAIDIYTTIAGTIYYVILRYPLSEPVDWSRVYCCDMSNFVPSIVAFGLTVIVTGSSVTLQYAFERVK